MSAEPIPSTFRIIPETAADRDEVDALVMDAFGPGRFVKTAERIRESARMVALGRRLAEHYSVDTMVDAYAALIRQRLGSGQPAANGPLPAATLSSPRR